MSKDLQQLAELIDRLDTTPVQGREESRLKNKEFGRTVFARMMHNGGTFGEAAGTMPWLNGPDALHRLRALKDDLGAQISMFDQVLDGWFEYGEPVAPGYPQRIAVILRKMKRADLEEAFLRSYGRHFISHFYGACSRDLIGRIEKVLGAAESEVLWTASEEGESYPRHFQLRKLGIFRNRYAAGHEDPVHFLCKRCGSRSIDIPSDRASKVKCSDCGTIFGDVAGFTEACRWVEQNGAQE